MNHLVEQANQRQHPADKFNTEEKESLSAIMKESQNTDKKARLKYLKVKNNMCLVMKHEIMPKNSVITDLHGNSLNAAEETLFKVMQVGEKTDDYVMGVEVGDIVLVTNFVPHLHLPTTEAVNRFDEPMPYYFVVALNDIGAVVSYERIDKKAVIQ